MHRRSVLKTTAGAALIPVVAGCTSNSATSSSTSSSTTYSLDFDTSSPKTLTKTVSVGSKSVTVKYEFYANNVYVQHPVDYKYQSLNVSVPIEIDGKSIDATSAQIMFAINVGGYASSSTYGATAQGGGVSAGNAGGGFGGGSSSGGAPSGGGAPTGAGAPPGGSSSGAPSGAGGAASADDNVFLSACYSPITSTTRTVTTSGCGAR